MNHLSIQYIKGLSAEALLELERAYPYFLLPKMFRLKKYFSEKHPDYQPLLHKTSIFSFKREALHDFLNNETQEIIPTPLDSPLPELKQPDASIEIENELEEPKTWQQEPAIAESTAIENRQQESVDEAPLKDATTELEPPVLLTQESINHNEEEAGSLLVDSHAEETDLAYPQPMKKEKQPTNYSEETMDSVDSAVTDEWHAPSILAPVNEIKETQALRSSEEIEPDTSDNTPPPALEIPAVNIREIEATIYNNIKDLLEQKSEIPEQKDPPQKIKEISKTDKAADIIQEASENSFLQWLKIVEKKKTVDQKRTASPIKGEEKLKMVLGDKSEKINVKKDPELDALEGFVKDQIKRKKKKNPHILEIPFEQTIQMSTEQMDIISEGLAQLLLKQGKFERATAMYQKLILKYPEKSAFFAAQIDLIKDLNN